MGDVVDQPQDGTVSLGDCQRQFKIIQTEFESRDCHDDLLELCQQLACAENILELLVGNHFGYLFFSFMRALYESNMMRRSLLNSYTALIDNLLYKSRFKLIMQDKPSDENVLEAYHVSESITFAGIQQHTRIKFVNACIILFYLSNTKLAITLLLRARKDDLQSESDLTDITRLVIKHFDEKWLTYINYCCQNEFYDLVPAIFSDAMKDVSCYYKHCTYDLVDVLIELFTAVIITNVRQEKMQHAYDKYQELHVFLEYFEAKFPQSYDHREVNNRLMDGCVAALEGYIDYFYEHYRSYLERGDIQAALSCLSYIEVIFANNEFYAENCWDMRVLVQLQKARCLKLNKSYDEALIVLGQLCEMLMTAPLTPQFINSTRKTIDESATRICYLKALDINNKFGQAKTIRSVRQLSSAWTLLIDRFDRSSDVRDLVEVLTIKIVKALRKSGYKTLSNVIIERAFSGYVDCIEDGDDKLERQMRIQYLNFNLELALENIIDMRDQPTVWLLYQQYRNIDNCPGELAEKFYLVMDRFHKLQLFPEFKSWRKTRFGAFSATPDKPDTQKAPRYQSGFGFE